MLERRRGSPLLPGWLIALLIGLGGFLGGAGLTLAAVHGRRASAARPERESARQSARPAPPATENAPEPRRAYLFLLLAQSLREPLRRLRRAESTSAEAIAELERVAWTARMLGSGPRPMQAQPASPISLLQDAAEEVDLLRLGKVSASWTLLTRRPVHLDAARARAALRELLQAGADATGEGGRLAIRIHEGERSGYPVQVEIEIGRRGAEADPLALAVARHLLESQGARLELDGQVMRVALRSQMPGPPDRPAAGPREAG